MSKTPKNTPAHLPRHDEQTQYAMRKTADDDENFDVTFAADDFDDDFDRDFPEEVTKQYDEEDAELLAKRDEAVMKNIATPEQVQKINDILEGDNEESAT